jgi:hypothetical protein
MIGKQMKMAKNMLHFTKLQRIISYWKELQKHDYEITMVKPSV